MAEYLSTLSWFANPSAQVSAHIVIAVDGEIAQCVADPLVAWHDPSSNAQMLGVELVQALYGDPISDAQIGSLAWWLRGMGAKYGFPLDPDHLPFHSQTASGISQGKSDPYKRNDPEGGVLRARLLKALGG